MPLKAAHSLPPPAPHSRAVLSQLPVSTTAVWERTPLSYTTLGVPPELPQLPCRWPRPTAEPSCHGCRSARSDRLERRSLKNTVRGVPLEASQFLAGGRVPQVRCVVPCRSTPNGRLGRESHRIRPSRCALRRGTASLPLAASHSRAVLSQFPVSSRTSVRGECHGG